MKKSIILVFAICAFAAMANNEKHDVMKIIAHRGGA